MTKIKEPFKKLFWYIGENNFGDLLGPYIYEKITKTKALHANPKLRQEYIYLTVGSIMSQANKKSIIWGSGIIKRNDRFQKPFKTISVRGPLTRQKFIQFGYPCPEIYGDPALLLPKIYTSDNKIKYQLGIIPHIIDYINIKKKYNIFTLNFNIKYSHKNIENVIDKLNQCQYTISSSLHGIIVSHAYNIPCLWVKFSNKLYGDDVKFYDYYLSIGIDNPKCLDLRNNTYSKEELVEFIKNAPQPIFPINTNQLWNSCPFNISN